jgi:helix-turn-helix protein
MSIKVMNQIWESGHYANGTLLVLLALGDWANDEGQCWPSIKKLAAKCRMGERNTQNALNRLEKDGAIIRRINRGRGHANDYQINLQYFHLFEPEKGETHCTFSSSEKVQNSTLSLDAKGEKSGAKKVKSLDVKGEKSGAEKVKPIAPHPSCRTVMHEPSLQQQAETLADNDLPAAAKDFDEPHLSVFPRSTVEAFVIATKKHIRNPGGFARTIWWSGVEDKAIERWKAAEEKRREPQERIEQSPAESEDWDWDKHVDDLIARNDLSQLQNELEGIEERGGPVADWERRVIAYFNPAADAA